jgi:hypothetical protein
MATGEHGKRLMDLVIVTCVGQDQVCDSSEVLSILLTTKDDYIWISRTGELQLYGNSHNPPNWIQYGIIYTPPASLMKEHFRKDIHLADS